MHARTRGSRHVFGRQKRLSTESPPHAGAPRYPAGTYTAERFYRGVPYPSGVRRGVPWTHIHARHCLIAASYNVRGAFRDVRRRLKVGCLEQMSPALMIFH